MIKIEGTVRKIIAKDPKSNFHFMEVVATDDVSKKILREKCNKESIVIKGYAFSPKFGDAIICEGDFSLNPKYGVQFESVQTYPAKLTKEKHTLACLQSNLFKGLAKDDAIDIFKKYGDNVFSLLEKDPKKIRDELSPSAHRALVVGWLRSKELINDFGFLKSLDLTTEISANIAGQMNGGAIKSASTFPYSFTGLNKVGFKIADTIAMKMGMSENSDDRVRNGITFALNSISESGGTKVYLTDFKEKLFKMTEMDRNNILTIVNQSIDDGIISLMNDRHGRSFVISYELFKKEMSAANELKRIMQHPLPFKPSEPKRIDPSLNERQRESVYLSVFNKVSIVTGGPGVGKTKTTKCIIEALEECCSNDGHKNKVVLCAPTGKAARRMSKSTGRDSGTIHSLLEYTPNVGCLKNENNKLNLDTLIIDEFSMVDINMFNAILNALPSSARLILIGDADQLPSVDPGNVLQDLIDSQCVGSTKLTKTYRQKEGSHIISNAHLINDGQMPVIDPKSEDFHWIDAENDEDIAKIVTRLMSEVIPKSMGIKIDDIQVLSPQKATLAGVDNLNEELKKQINPLEKSRYHFNSFGDTFCVNERVMQIKNNKTLGINNGEVGKISFIDHKSRVANVVFDGVEKAVPFASFKDMRLGYACTVHKSQGSEFDAVIIPVSKNHERMLTPENVYTAMTRGKKQVFFVGSRDALKRGLSNKYRRKRHTSLVDCILNAFNIEHSSKLDVRNEVSSQPVVLSTPVPQQKPEPKPADIIVPF